MKYLKTLLFISIIALSSCNRNNISSTSSEQNSSNDNQNISLIAPSGTPLLAISTYLSENKYVNYDVANGADPLLAAFTAESHDIIVAPVNLGANIYNKTKKYVLFETIVWGNLYVVSKNPISSFNDLNNKTITLFGTNQTPDILMKTLAKENNITYETIRVDAVDNANSLFLQNQAEYIVSAEPSLSKIKEKVQNLHILDLQEEWKKISGQSSYPQASVFVNKNKVESLKNDLLKIKKCVTDILKDKNYTVQCAMETPLKTLGETTLTSALPNCHIGIDENQKDAIEFYFNKLKDLELGATFGGELPDENFYISI